MWMSKNSASSLNQNTMMRSIIFCGIFCTFFLCTFTLDIFDDFENRITVDITNMPAVWQVDAADALETAYELETTTNDRLKMFTELFYSKHTDFAWIAVLNYEELYFTGQHFIRLKTGNDSVFLYTGNPTAPPPVDT